MRLDKIPAGSVVTWTDPRFNFEENAIFLGIEGTGNDRKAKFVSRAGSSGSTYNWSAYRFNGRWSYGSSADYMKILDYTEII